MNLETLPQGWRIYSRRPPGLSGELQMGARD